MATLQLRNGTSYRVLFRYGGKRFNLPVGQVSRSDAELVVTQVVLITVKMLFDLERGVLMPNPPSVIRLVSRVLDLPADKLIAAGGLQSRGRPGTPDGGDAACPPHTGAGTAFAPRAGRA